MSAAMVFPRKTMDGVAEYRRLAWRAWVLQTAASGLPAVWEPVLPGREDLLAVADDCYYCSARVRRLCRPCPYREVCLAAALWLDDDRPWVAFMSRRARTVFFDELVALAAVLDPWAAAGRQSA